MSADITRPQGDSQLTIPEEAVTLAVQAVDYAATDETTEMISVALEAAAPLIVATELERLAAAFGDFNRRRLRTMALDKGFRRHPRAEHGAGASP